MICKKSPKSNESAKQKYQTVVKVLTNYVYVIMF